MALQLDKIAAKKFKASKQIEKKHTILVVDDEESNLRAVVSTLEKEFEIMTATNGQEGLELVKGLEDPEQIHLIISDQRMPKMTGVDFLEKTISIIPNTMRMILTGYADIDVIIDSINKGQIYKFITKPIDPQDLKVTAKRAIEVYELEKKNLELIDDLKNLNASLEQKVQERTNEVQERTNELEEAYQIIKIQKERMEGELNVGRDIQMSMLPLEFPAFPNREEFDIYAILEPAREVGGDFYDFFFIDEDLLCFCVGDVSEKGVPSALIMAVTQTLIKSRAASDFSTASIMTHANDELSQDNPSCMFVTLYVCILNVRTGELTYTNAGHNPPYLKRANGSLKRMDILHGPMIGAMEGITYKEDRIMLSKGDMLHLYTDGVTEDMDIENNLFSEKRLADLLSSQDYETAIEAVQSIMTTVKQFEGEADPADDITIMAIQFFGDPKADSSQLFEITIKNDLSEIDQVNTNFNQFAEHQGISDTIRRKINFAFDDLLNNTISYAYVDENEHEIKITAEIYGNHLTVKIEDDGIPFNPFVKETPDTELSLVDRENGGMGIHLVRTIMDKVSYKRKIDKNVITLVKHINDNNKSQ